MYAYIYIYINACIHVYMYTHIHIYACTYIYVSSTSCTAAMIVHLFYLPEMISRSDKKNSRFLGATGPKRPKFSAKLLQK